MTNFFNIFSRKTNLTELDILKRVYNQTPLEIAIYSLDNNYIFLNDQFYTNNFEKENFINRDDLHYFKTLNIESTILDKRKEAFKQVLEEKKTVTFTEKFYFPNSGKTLYFKRTYRPLFLNSEQEISHIASFGNNITAIILSQKELRYLAFHDKLTGLGNRDAFNQQVEQMLLESRRWKDKRVSAILFCDLDNFKLVNDSLGHDVGDLLLIEVSQRIKDALRLSDYIYRLGGDEFTIILKDLQKETDAGIVAEKLISSISKPYEINNHNITYLTISVGIAVYPKDGSNRETLTSNADLAMYEAKKNSKNNFKYFSEELTQSSKNRLQIVKNLKEVIQQKDYDKQFNVLYQPIFEKNQENRYNIVGSEALLRWFHPQRGNISPRTFIPIAEESNLIQHFGSWIFERSLSDFKTLLTKHSEKPLFISLNLSAKQLSAPDLIESLDSLVKKSGVPHTHVQIEITETSIIEDGKAAIYNLNKLKDLGFKLAIDDFGVGFASLSYLQKIPASVIKIDRMFIQKAGLSRENSDLVKAIIALGQNLNKEIIAEGVEQKMHLDFLIKNQCYRYQGYYFSKPLNIKDFEKALLQEKESLPIQA